MKLYLSSVFKDKHNISYPVEIDVVDEETLRQSQQFDHIMCRMQDNIRAVKNFTGTNCLFADVDNTHSDDSFDWVSIDDATSRLSPYEFFLATSSSHMVEKDGKAARPKFHLFFPIPLITDSGLFNRVMAGMRRQEFAQGFDKAVKDPSRFFFGNRREDIICIHHKGVAITELLFRLSDLFDDESADKSPVNDSGTSDKAWRDCSWEEMRRGDGRNARLYFEGTFQLKKGMLPTDLVGFIQKTNGRMAAPLDADELKSVTNQILRLAPDKWGQYQAGQEAEKAAEPEEEDDAALDEKYGAFLLELKTLDEIDQMDIPPTPKYIDNIIHRGVTWLAGESKVGKSWLVMQMAQSIATGTSVLGRDVKQGRVLYMALEEEEADFQTRVRMQGFNLKHKNCLVLQRSELTQKHLGDPGYIKYIVKKENIDVVFVDTHGAFSPKVSNGSGDAYEKWTEIMQPLVSLARGCKIALVLITHTTKYAEASGDTNPNNALTGSSAKQGNSDNILTLFKRGELNISGRTVKGMKLAVEFNESNGLWSLSNDNKKILKPKELLKESIVHTLRASKMPMTKDQIAGIIKDEPFFTSDGAFKNALSDLSQHNGVTKMRTSGNLVTYKLEE